MSETIDAIEAAFEQLALGNVIMPERLHFTIPEYNSSYWSMPAYIGGGFDAWGTKILTINYDNPAKFNLPWTLGIVMLPSRP